MTVGWKRKQNHDIPHVIPYSSCEPCFTCLMIPVLQIVFLSTSQSEPQRSLWWQAKWNRQISSPSHIRINAFTRLNTFSLLFHQREERSAETVCCFLLMGSSLRFQDAFVTDTDDHMQFGEMDRRRNTTALLYIHYIHISSSFNNLKLYEIALAL